MRTILIALLMTIATKAGALDQYSEHGFSRWHCYTGGSTGGSFIFLNFEKKLIAQGAENAWRNPQKLLSFDVNFNGTPKSVVWLSAYDPSSWGQAWAFRYFSLKDLIYRQVQVSYVVDKSYKEPTGLNVFEFDEFQKKHQNCKKL